MQNPNQPPNDGLFAAWMACHGNLNASTSTNTNTNDTTNRQQHPSHLQNQQRPSQLQSQHQHQQQPLGIADNFAPLQVPHASSSRSSSSAPPALASNLNPQGQNQGTAARRGSHQEAFLASILGPIQYDTEAAGPEDEAAAQARSRNDRPHHDAGLSDLGLPAAFRSLAAASGSASLGQGPNLNVSINQSSNQDLSFNVNFSSNRLQQDSHTGMPRFVGTIGSQQQVGDAFGLPLQMQDRSTGMMGSQHIDYQPLRFASATNNATSTGSTLGLRAAGTNNSNESMFSGMLSFNEPQQAPRASSSNVPSFDAALPAVQGNAPSFGNNFYNPSNHRSSQDDSSFLFQLGSNQFRGGSANNVNPLLLESPLLASSSLQQQNQQPSHSILEQQQQQQQPQQGHHQQSSLHQDQLQQRLQLQQQMTGHEQFHGLGAATNTSPIDTTIEGATPQVLPPEAKWKGRGRSSTFPLKLHQMLLDLEQREGGTEIASFLPHGRGFQIFKPKEFSREILPHYFRMSTFSSFQRQLNLYDFQRIAEGPEKGAYWHELFLKDQPMLSTGMKRNKVKGSTRARQEERFKHYSHQQGQPQQQPQQQQQHQHSNKEPPRSPF